MKKLLSLLLVLASLLSLTACHGARGSTAFVAPEEFDTSQDYEITFWAKNDSNATQTNIYRQAIADFEALYPNITVNLKLYTDYGRIYNDVITNISTGTTPNVCITYPDHIATYMTGENTVVPLDSLFANPKYGLGGSQLRFEGPTQEQIVPQFLREGMISGMHYALPFMRSTEACYVNKTYVEKLGYTLPETLTWDFVWEVSQAAMAKDENGNYLLNGQKVMIPFMYKSTDNMMIQMLKQRAADYSSPNGDILLFNDDTRDILYTIGENAALRSFDTFKSTGYPANYLNAGQCIFAVDSTAGATWMGCDAPLIDIAEEDLVEFETVVMTIPQYHPDNPKMISQGPSLCIFNKEDPQEVLASWLFAQFLLTDSVQLAYAQTEGYVPVTRKAQESKEYLDYLSRSGQDNEHHYSIKIDATQLLLSNTENTFVTPVFNGSASLRDAAGYLIEETRKSARRGEKIDEAYTDGLFTKTTSLYRLDQAAVNTGAGGKASLGPLPQEAVMLLGGLAIVWVTLGIYSLSQAIKNKKQKNR